MKITKEGLENSSAWIVPPNSILFSMYASLGETSISKIPVATNQAIMAIIPSNNIDIEYLYYALQWIRPGLYNLIRETTQKNLNGTIVRNIGIPLPSLSMQKVITKILSHCDNIKYKRSLISTLSKHILEQLFIGIFGDLHANRHNWHILSLKELLTQDPQNGIFKKENFYGSGTPIVWVEDIDEFILNTRNLRHIELTDSEKVKYSIENGDILITRSSHTGVEGVGVTTIAENLDECAVFESHTIRIRANPNLINPYFLVAYFRSPFGRDLIARIAKRGTMTTISQPDILKTEVIIPPRALQVRIAIMIRKINSLKKTYTDSEKMVNELSNYLVYSVFNRQDKLLNEYSLDMKGNGSPEDQINPAHTKQSALDNFLM